MLRRYLAEAVGTFFLVFAGCGAICVSQTTHEPPHVGVALVFGLIVMVMIYSIGDLSGAHINPAVTIAFSVARRFPVVHILPYVLAQCAGAILASLLLRYLFPDLIHWGVTSPRGTEMQSFVLEVALTWLLMFVVMNVSTGAKEKGITAAIAVGGTIAVDALFGGPISGASMNPARSLGPALVSGQLEHIWIYLLAPIVGALLGVVTAASIREDCCCPPHEAEKVL